MSKASWCIQFILSRCISIFSILAISDQCPMRYPHVPTPRREHVMQASCIRWISARSPITAVAVAAHPKPPRGCSGSNLEPNLTLHLESADDTCRTEGWRVDDEQAAARAPDRCRMCVRSLRGARRRVRGSGRARGGAGAPLTGVAARTRRGVDPFECGRRERACRPPTVASGPALRLGR